MPDLAKLYDLHAEECARAAERTDYPRYRALLIKCAAEWREAAQALRQSPQPDADGARDRDALAQAPVSTGRAPEITPAAVVGENLRVDTKELGTTPGTKGLTMAPAGF